MALLGVHVIGEQATELVHIGLMGMLTGCASDLFGRACFNFPTLGELLTIPLPKTHSVSEPPDETRMNRAS